MSNIEGVAWGAQEKKSMEYVSLSVPKCFVRCKLVSGSTSRGALGDLARLGKVLQACNFPGLRSCRLLMPLLLSLCPHGYKRVVYSPCLINALCSSWPLIFNHMEGQGGEPFQGWAKDGRGRPWPWGSHWALCTSSIQTCLPSLPSSQILHFQINILTKGNCADC